MPPDTAGRTSPSPSRMERYQVSVLARQGQSALRCCAALTANRVLVNRAHRRTTDRRQGAPCEHVDYVDLDRDDRDHELAHILERLE